METDGAQATSTRERLLQAAFEVFAEKGYSGTRVQEIARRAGFTTGAIYANFNGKAALLGEAIGSQGLEALTASIWGARHMGSASEILHYLGVQGLVVESRPVDTLLLDALAAAARDPEVAALVQPQVYKWRDELITLMESAREKGEVREEFSTESLVSVSVALSLGSFMLRALDMPRPPADEVDKVIRGLILAFATDKAPLPPEG